MTTQVRVPTTRDVAVKRRVKMKGKWVTRTIPQEGDGLRHEDGDDFEPRTVTSMVATRCTRR